MKENSVDKVKVTKDIENSTLVIERVFHAPKEKVWRAYADKQWFEAWWGPEGWQTTTKEFDFKPGGTIHYGMKCVDKNQGEWFGQESWGMMKIETTDEPNTFTAQDFFCNAEGEITEGMPAQRFVVELVEVEGGTNLVSKSVCENAEQLEQLVKLGMTEGFSSQLNRLEELLAK